MVKLGLLLKQEAERILNQRLKDAESFFLIKYSGLSAADLNFLRGSLDEVDSSFMVFKNSVGRRVLQSHESLKALIQGPCGLIFVNKDLLSSARVLYEFIKNKPNLEVKAGLLNDRVLTQEEIQKLSKIPSLTALQSQVLGALKSPISGLAFSLKHMLNKLVWVLDQIKEKKGK